MGLFFGHNQITSSADNRFIITIDTNKGTGASFTLPLRNSYTYNCTVTWGDGTSSLITAYDDPDRIHTYAAHGVYQITISGTFRAWLFNNGGDKLKLIQINNWGLVDFGAIGLQGAFYGCSNLTTIPDLIRDTTITAFTDTFRNCTSLTSIPSNLFKNLTGVTSFNNTFYGCSALTTIPTDIFRYNTLCNSFQGTFYLCTALTTIPTDVFRYNTAVTRFDNIFRACYALRNLPENLFYYNEIVTIYSSCFAACRNLILPSVMFNLDSLDFVTSFNNFMDVTETYYSPTGTIQSFWNYSGSATSVDAFDQCTSITNYADIPTAWK